MMWPWVSREYHDSVVNDFLAVRKDEREWHRVMMAQLAKNLTDVLAINAGLANPVIAPPPEVPHIAPKEKSPIALRIDDVSEGDPQVKRFFWSQVSKWRREGQSDGDIIGLIRWTTTEPNGEHE